MVKFAAISMALMLALIQSSSAATPDPIPNIKANYSDGPITITPQETLTISAELSPGGNVGANADWWIAAYNNSLGWFYYDLARGWVSAGNSSSSLAVTYQGPLVSLGSTKLLSASSLPSGVYEFYFGVDMTMNARLDGPLYADHVTATVATSTESLANLEPFYGDYNVTFNGQVGGEYEPTNSIITGTTTGISSFTVTGTITLTASEPGVIAVPAGENIPGVAPEDVIFGAAVMQNPIHVFMGTSGATQTGDFGIFSEVRYGIPAGPNILNYTGCSSVEGGPFDCVPIFFESTTPSGDSVNLVYFTNQVAGNNGAVTISGKLVDVHTAEAAAANLFAVPIESPILGTFNDQFMFEKGATFEITVSGNSINGRFQGAGGSVAGLAPQTAIYNVTFEGVKREN